MTRKTATTEPSDELANNTGASVVDPAAEGQDQRLDEALEETFPASDPISSSKVD